MVLALFDLDHTLIPLDSDYEWTRYFIRQAPAAQRTALAAKNQKLMDDYNAGTLDPHESLSFLLGLLTQVPRETLERWREGFFRDVVAPQLQPQARALIAQHQAAGHEIAVVTATNRFVVTPIVAAFDVQHLMATEPEQLNGAFTGRWVGVPCFQAGKIDHVQQWLATRGQALNSFAKTYFYSDSINDLPLLERVTDPVATNPSPKLEAVARERGWKVVKLWNTEQVMPG
jgi:HAD superfamily hydrolase (TIGR01490 family)